jgi:hypothetical protein
MLRIKLEVKQDRPKELSPTEYEFTQGVVKSEDLRGKKLYYTVENVFKTNTLPGSFRLYTARKFDATNKLTGKVKVNKGTFYDGHDYGAQNRFNNTFHNYSLRRCILFTRTDQADNQYIFEISNKSLKQRIPEYLINVKNVAELDEKVKFTIEGFSWKNDVLDQTSEIHAGQFINFYLNIYTED